MCGIVGFLGTCPALEIIVQALKGLEYRGYDSSGVALIEHGRLLRHRAVGTLDQLMKVLPETTKSTLGIGHTRWATHGAPEERNAHPQVSHGIAVVHNGIIENFSELKAQLLKQGYAFESETDTEVVAHFIHQHYSKSKNVEEVFSKVLKELEGSFALAIILEDHPNHIFIARKGISPLAIGRSAKGISLCSDTLSLVGIADELSYIEDGVWGDLSLEGIKIFDENQISQSIEFVPHPLGKDSLGRGEFSHYMLKEMYEQPDIVLKEGTQTLDIPKELSKALHITLIGCGSAFYAAWGGKYYLEQLANRIVTLELASEFHYRNPVVQDGVTIAVSQSGETADTLKAIQYMEQHGQYTVGMVNVPHSSISRQVHYEILTKAGPEIGVASTKAFTAQLLCLLKISMNLMQDSVRKQKILKGLKQLPLDMQKIFFKVSQLQDIAQHLVHSKGIIFLGRGMSYPVALEGALKMSELSYIPGQGFAAGELKHGPLALVDACTPVVVLAPMDQFFEKTVSNIYEVCAREGKVFVITDNAGAEQLAGVPVQDIFVYPSPTTWELHPFLSVLTLQLIAYYTALHKGCSIDQPRNLAKAVTVE
ncbi:MULTISPECIES: glutamine--fructose-6-phosphate transaminase (isomerizing) [Holospora]|uniref:Glutamine--fructose-6-phosphate aminotransferase [isomerizing] n=2 Tax=Holospora TaxID=44747 RepID=A0A061JHA0_9PROT|nr:MULTISPECIES: glutamine--fructose-6-phosphate transaminase (isomerizing) [Holospora]ETZ05540.1 glutamine--fructose-6-phosphate aminotransferase [isomerizing] [Holospora undulata HU1]GAJ45744.1 glutamine--fructose-6-phosphate aminotransferase [isomerizing] [Holospora elegans E1]